MPLNKDMLVPEIPHLRRYALSLTRDPAQADDLVQDCLARAIEKRALFRTGTNLRAWMFAMLRNLFRNSVRSSQRKEAVVDDDAATLRWCHAPQDGYTEMCEVARALDTLSAPHREILTLVVVEGWSYEEAGARLNVPVGTVRSRIARARGELTQRLKTYGAHEAAASGQVAMPRGPG
ncbi:RNA polymerase sigma-70 factor, ECF subfamily [Limimonas halophila]|uniref:RNA polymerase sigma-70 factor, ECF subfamily n=1 Tax=Limimonas halophila TaxID=1082479 RepID=A0A1G7LIH1_9PROT|nr:sigma-70 family RNA polymerase sigma factor [Limimonas halophila]SDF49243.1 RNA polymerase sigma-70 factor, ECF subfamily [Limimonas halophila]